MARSSDRGALYQRDGSPFWWCRYRDASGRLVRASTGCRDREAATARWRQLEREAMGAASPSAPTTTLTDAIARMIEACRAKGLAKSTIAYYSEKATNLCAFFGAHSDLRRAVTARSVDDYIASRRGVVSQHSVSKELKTLRIVLATARRRGEYDLDVAQVLPVAFATGYVPRKTALTMTQVECLLEHIHDVGFAAWVAFAVATGARKSEINRAFPGDVDFDAGRVFLRGTKTARAERHVPILPPTEPLLRRAVRDADGVDRLFARRDWPLTALGDASHRAGVPRVTPNDLRRTFATQLEERGVPHETIARLLGHASTAMVERVYGQARSEVLLASVSDLYREDRARDAQPAQPDTNQAGKLRARPDSNGRPAASKASASAGEASKESVDALCGVLDPYSELEAPLADFPGALAASRRLRKCLADGLSGSPDYADAEVELRRTRGA